MEIEFETAVFVSIVGALAVILGWLAWQMYPTGADLGTQILLGAGIIIAYLIVVIYMPVKVYMATQEQ